MKIHKNSDLGTKEQLLGSVLTVGHFNSVHQGHIRLSRIAHEIARKSNVKYGIVLIDDIFPDLEIFRPVETRVQECLNLLADFVVIANSTEIPEIFEFTRPNLIIQGISKFDNIYNFLSKNIKTINEYECEVRFFSTSKSVFHLDSQTNFFSKLDQFKKICISLGIRFEKLKESLNLLDERKCFLVGDTLIDEYLFCDFSSMSGEAPLPVFNVGKTEVFFGGASAVFRHLENLGCNVRFCTSLLGVDHLRSRLTSKGDQVFSTEHVPVLTKRRYISDNQKLFRVNFPSFEHGSIGIADQSEQIINREILRNYTTFKPDFVIATDFGSGFFSQERASVLEEISKEMPHRTYIDAQITPTRNGFDSFKRCGLLFPTEKEARETAGMLDDSIDSVAEYYLERSACNRIVITCGGEGVIGFDQSSPMSTTSKLALPALNQKPIDLTGAGDAFLCGFAVSDSNGNTFGESLVLGSIFAAVHTSSIGNEAVMRSEIDKCIEYIINA